MFIHDQPWIQPPALVRSVTHPSFRDVMFGTMINPHPGSDKENETVTAQREYDTNSPYGQYPSVQAPPSSCSQTLTEWQNDGRIPAGETCSCPTGATTPQCSYTNAAELCADALAQEESYPNMQYDYCACTAGAITPTCTPYYTLCKDGLSSYSASHPYDSCSCESRAVSATPSCISYYQLCQNQLSTVQSQNPDDVCYCNDPSTSANPVCESDYSVCQSRISQYENSTTTCSCSNTSSNPYCCTGVQAPITGEISYSGIGNGWTITGGSSWSFSDPGAARYGFGYTQTNQYNPAYNQFSGSININGTVEVGVVCGGNSGLYGSGNEILPLNQPNDSSCQQPEPESTQTATGTPIQLASAESGGDFSGGPIYVNDAWGTFVFQVDSSNQKCIEGAYESAGSYESLGTLCANNTLNCTSR